MRTQNRRQKGMFPRSAEISNKIWISLSLSHPANLSRTCASLSLCFARGMGREQSSRHARLLNLILHVGGWARLFKGTWCSVFRRSELVPWSLHNTSVTGRSFYFRQGYGVGEDPLHCARVRPRRLRVPSCRCTTLAVHRIPPKTNCKKAKLYTHPLSLPLPPQKEAALPPAHPHRRSCISGGRFP